MQFDALFIALPIAPPSTKAAMAMPVPTMARMSAYSAAEAPDSSLIILMKFDMFFSFPRFVTRHAGHTPVRLRKVALANTAAPRSVNYTGSPLGAVELPPKAARLTQGL